MGIVAALLSNSARLNRVRSVTRGRHIVEACTDWGAVTTLCAAQPVHMAVVDVFETGAADLESLRRLRRSFPRLTIVAYLSPSLEQVGVLFDLGRMGIDALILADRDDTLATMSAIFEQAEARSVAGPLRRHLARAHPVARDAALLAVIRAHERLTPERVASMLLVTRRVLARQLRIARLPAPQRLVTWGRLIVAAHLMEDQERSADRVARALHFPSGSAFRNMCQRYVRATPSMIRDCGGAEWVIDCMLRDDNGDDDVGEVLGGAA